MTRFRTHGTLLTAGYQPAVQNPGLDRGAKRRRLRRQLLPGQRRCKPRPRTLRGLYGNANEVELGEVAHDVVYSQGLTQHMMSDERVGQDARALSWPVMPHAMIAAASGVRGPHPERRGQPIGDRHRADLKIAILSPKQPPWTHGLQAKVSRQDQNPATGEAVPIREPGKLLTMRSGLDHYAP